MRRLALALLALLSLPLLMVAGAQARPFVPNDADAQALDAVSAYLNGITTLKGGFLQIEPSGAVDEGMFYISKPGKMRFEYKPPSATLLVSDGRVVAVANTRLNTVDRYFLSDTPLGLILNKSIDLRHDPQLTGVAHQQGALVVSLRTVNRNTKASITLVFSEPDYELRQWSVLDNQGTTTTVALRALVPGAVLPDALFVLPEKKH